MIENQDRGDIISYFPRNFGLNCVREIHHGGALHQLIRGGLFFPIYNSTRGITTLVGVGSGDQCSDHPRKKSEEAIASMLAPCLGDSSSTLFFEALNTTLCPTKSRTHF